VSRDQEGVNIIEAHNFVITEGAAIKGEKSSGNPDTTILSNEEMCDHFINRWFIPIL
jgi:hypothetical protein